MSGSYEVTIYPEKYGEKPYTARYTAPTSTDALLRAAGDAREGGVRLVKVTKVVALEPVEKEED